MHDIVTRWCCVLVHLALESRYFEAAGKLMALSIVNSGPLPAFLHSHLYDTIVGSPQRCKLTVQDVNEVDHNVSALLLKVGSG